MVKNGLFVKVVWFSNRKNKMVAEEWHYSRLIHYKKYLFITAYTSPDHS
jgi:hypothetical protein